jgi:ribitol-5-phosphate 2-dehydrogenase
VVLLGVTEDLVPVNTRDILERGLRLVGVSRSTPVDMARTLHYLRRPNLREAAAKLVIDRVFSISEINEAFEFALHKRQWGKVVIDLASG